MQVDITTRLGALTQATPTGFPSLDTMLNGGLRTGTVLAVSGAPGVGRTSLALLIAYMAARARAGVVFASVGLDMTETFSRLAARALHREYPELAIPYAGIWSGQAWQNDTTRRPVADAVETVVKKVGSQLYLYRAPNAESTTALAECAAHLWSRHERAVLVVDDIEAFYARSDTRLAGSSANLEGRVLQATYDLKHIAEQGCAVIVTSLERHAQLLAPASTLACELRSTRESDDENAGSSVRSMDLIVKKNRLGPTGVVPLRFHPGAGLFEERA
jgi:replicative DNA helicase